MAETNILVAQDQFWCTVCLEILKDPVTIPCGHSFCMLCINDCWNQEDQKGHYSCPHCRQTFSPRPDVRKNIILAEVVEKLKDTGVQTLLPAHTVAGSEFVACDFCTGRKYKAIKSCLVCLASYCETHLQPHYESPALKKHELVKASRQIQVHICCQHDKLLEVYCCTDQQCICMLCTMDEHKGHDIVSAAAEKSKKQKRLVEIQRKYCERIQNGDEELQELRNTVVSYKSAALNIERISTELIKSIERRCSELTELIRDQEKAAMSQAKEDMEQLEQEFAELKRRAAELEKLSHMEDPIHFLQRFQFISAFAKTAELPIITSSPLNYFGEVTKSVSHLKEKLEDICNEEFDKISSEVKNFQIIPPPEPQIRKEFLQYFCQLTLDPNTANQHLCVSDRGRVVTFSNSAQSYPDHPDRFDYYLQVLCRESVCGRCYWEVEWSGRGSEGISIAVSYKGIARKGDGYECLLGHNDRSWRLFCSPSSFSFCHNNMQTEIPIKSSCFRVGVYVDYSAGTLSFYSISDTVKLLHRVQTTFTQPLYPGFYINPGLTVKLSDCKETVSEV